MKITITDGNSVFNFDVEHNETVENIKALLEVQTSIPSARLIITFQGKKLRDQDKLDQNGVKEGQLLYFLVSQQPLIQPQNQASQQQKAGLSIAQIIKNFDKTKKQTHENIFFQEKPIQAYIKAAQQTYKQIKDDHFRISELSESNPQLATLLMNGDIKGIAEFLRKKDNQRTKKIREQQKRFLELSKDPMNPEYQKMVQQRIHQENIEKNYQYAHEYIPEVFGHITMLYINASINKVPIQAFVDSGAQSTIISQSLAQRCGLMRLVDKRLAGTAIGVGTCKILGKIHAADIEIEKQTITCSFTVIQNNGVQFLLGLDMLKRFRCLIDLKKNELNFNDGLIVTKFLSEGEIKKNKGTPTKQQLEEKIKKITSMGFSKDQAIRALKSSNYNQQVASNMLMQNRFGK